MNGTSNTEDNAVFYLNDYPLIMTFKGEDKALSITQCSPQFIIGFILNNTRKISSISTGLLHDVLEPDSWTWINHHSPALFEDGICVSPFMFLAMARKAVMEVVGIDVLG